MFDLKPLSKEGVAAALEKAMRYRMLNEPGEAEKRRFWDVDDEVTRETLKRDREIGGVVEPPASQAN